MEQATGRTSSNNYFEDPEPLIAHARGKTVTEMDNVLLTNMVKNTADATSTSTGCSSNARHSGFDTRIVWRRQLLNGDRACRPGHR
jgi:hypothetical protein